MAFIFFLEVRRHIAHGHIPIFVSHLLTTSQVITLEKQIDDIQPITNRKVI